MQKIKVDIVKKPKCYWGNCVPLTYGSTEQVPKKKLMLIFFEKHTSKKHTKLQKKMMSQQKVSYIKAKFFLMFWLEKIVMSEVRTN